MKYFIKKTFFFVIAPILLGLPILLMFNHYLKALTADYKIDPDISTVFIGDSHIQLAINDSIIPQCLNVASSAESFYFSYYKLKVLLDGNPSIKHIYLGLSFHSMSNYYDKFTSGDFSSSIAPKYYSILPPKEQIRMIYWNKNNLMSFMKKIIKQGTTQTLNNKKYSFIGGYSKQFKETVAIDTSMDKRLRSQYYSNGNLNSFSALNIHYLNKMASLCSSKGVNFTVVNTPLHKYYYKKIPKEYKNKLDEIVSTNHLNYIDLSNLQLSDKCFIPDGDHVSFLGAIKTSIRLKEIIFK